MEIIVSIIVPVYNSEKYVANCINSILKQNYPYFELLLIDDGSTDHSPQICDALAEKDFRIKVIHKKNGGASSARNLGLAISIGKYVTFIDSDDFIDEEMLLSAMNLMGPGVDLLISGTIMEYYNDYKITRTDKFVGLEKIYTTKTFLENLNIEYPLFCIGGPCAKLFNAEIIRENNLKFNTEMIVSEDTFFCVQFLMKTKIIAVSSHCFYHYRRVNSESLWSKYHKNLYWFQIKAYDEMRKLIKFQNCSQKAINSFEELYFDILVGCIQSSCKSKVNYDQRKRIIKLVADNPHVKLTIAANKITGLKRVVYAVLLKAKAYFILDMIFNVYYKMISVD